MEGVTSSSTAELGTGSSVISPLLICMLGIVLTTIAILTYHLILVKYCIRRHAAITAAAIPAAALRTPTAGVDEKILQAIPILAFSVIKRGSDQGECVVCLGELEDEDAVRLLPNCNHAFHVSCIDQWFAAHASCPLCRSPVLRQETDAAPSSPDPVEVSNFGGSGDDNASNGGGEPSRRQSIGSLRPCASLSTPIGAPMEQNSWWRLKRSLSMDLSLVVVIDLDRDRAHCSSATSFSSSFRGIRRSGSLSHFDRAPSKWLRSFSWLRTGKRSNGAILPY